MELDELSKQFSDYHEAVRKKNDELTSELKEVRSQLQRIVIPAGGRSIGPQTQSITEVETREERERFVRFIRTGELPIQTKAMSTVSDPDGGFVCPPWLDARINDIL